MTLVGQTYAVTGAASGIGAATAALLHEAGAEVIGVDRNTAADFPGTFVQADLSTAEGVVAVADRVPKGINGLLNIAGVPGTAPWRLVLSVNVFGVRDLTRVLLPKLVRGGVVVNLASNVASGWTERREQIIAFTSTENREAALDLASADPEITGNSYRFSKECVRWLSLETAASSLGRARVVSVSPGPVQTPILEDFKTDHGRDKVEGAVALLGRAGQPDDIAHTIRFLVSSEAAWINGTDVCVDGGLSAHRAVATSLSVTA
ncbi:SDR family oxidoreductase [Kocuria sp. SM24M-10]|uniref:SDR family oxidoreductase n=1 Tax=Kocuria sp. SM24M-10 TaxID=1660349 RepID=UPI000649F115|nr:SDR family oxidoreductase [Kocuria sp. SM24M-10]KLU10961.1 short-chain dehydrogenase [Kocuria sp. SM24M-10]